MGLSTQAFHDVVGWHEPEIAKVPALAGNIGLARTQQTMKFLS